MTHHNAESMGPRSLFSCNLMVPSWGGMGDSDTRSVSSEPDLLCNLIVLIAVTAETLPHKNRMLEM